MQTSESVKTPIWGQSDHQRHLEEFAASEGHYDLWFKLFRVRARQTGWAPRKLFPVMRRFTSSRRPYFRTRLASGVSFLGDIRDRYSLDIASTPNNTDPIIPFFQELAAQTDGCFVDVGANVGLISLEVARTLQNSANVYAFEPMQATARRASATFALNQLSNIFLLPVAASDTDGVLTFYEAPGDTDFASAHPASSFDVEWNKITLPCCTLDRLRDQGILPKIGLLKIDVEGHEISVFRGARKTIAADRPHIVFEYNYVIALTSGWKIKDVAAVLSEAGPYTLHTLSDDGHLTQISPDRTFEEHQEGFCNIYCKPAQVEK